MKIAKLLIFVFLFVQYNLNAQTQVKGSIEDQLKERIPYVTIRLYTVDTMLLGSYSSDSLGNFDFTMESTGKHLLKLSYFETKDTIVAFDVPPGKQVLDLGIIQFVNEMEEIVIESSVPLVVRKVDRYVFNVGASNLVNMASDAYELLARTPMVEVTNNSINIIGKQGAKVLINDRLFPLSSDELITFLRSVPAIEVDRIEVITNPPAQYDAQGNAGLINIITKKAKLLGTNGYLYLVNSQAFYYTGEITGSVGVRKQKFSLYGNLNYKAGSIRPIENQIVTDDNKINDQYSVHVEKYNRLRGNFGMDFRPSDKTSFGFSYSGTDNRVKMDDETRNEISTSDILDSVITSQGVKNTKNILQTLNFNSQHQFDSLGRKVVFNVDYISYRNNADRDFQSITDNFVNSYATNRLNGTDQKLDIGSSTLDFEIPLKKFNIKTGLKTTFIESNYDNSSYYFENGDYVLDTLQSNIFRYKENTNAAYASVEYSKNKFGLQIGLRGEDTHTTGNSLTLDSITRKHYFRVYPTVFLTYQLSEAVVLSLSYGKRINRPSYGALNPFKYYLTPNNYSQGNPLLSPSYSDNLELSCTLGSLIISSFFNRETRVITQAPFYDTLLNTVAVLQSNIGTTTSSGINVSLPFSSNKLSGNLNVNYMVNGFKTDLEQFSSNSRNHVFYFSLNADYGWGKNKKYSFSVASDISPFTLRQGIDVISPMYMINASFKVKLLNEKAFISAGINDIFLLSQPPVYSVSNGNKIKYINTYDTRNIRVAFAYMFGNRKMKGRSNGEEKNKEEKNRI